MKVIIFCHFLISWEAINLELTHLEDDESQYCPHLVSILTKVVESIADLILNNHNYGRKSTNLPFILFIQDRFPNVLKATFQEIFFFVFIDLLIR